MNRKKRFVEIVKKATMITKIITGHAELMYHNTQIMFGDAVVKRHLMLQVVCSKNMKKRQG